jgi:hypothetical protein
MNTQGLEIKDEVRMLVVGGRRIEANAEIWIPKSHPFRTGIAENRQGSFTRPPIDGLEQADTRAVSENPCRPRKIFPDTVIDPYKRC